MRRALALAALIALAAVGTASAEHWTKYTDGSAAGTAWSYDADYSYKDKATGRLVVMQAISKPESKLGPSAPGAADGVGSVVAIDCTKRNLIMMSGYSPSKPLNIRSNWREDTPKKAEGAENEALIGAVCPSLSQAPVK
jgi:uncharacterized protein YfiM (DUF2279 family)